MAKETEKAECLSKTGYEWKGGKCVPGKDLSKKIKDCESKGGYKYDIATGVCQSAGYRQIQQDKQNQQKAAFVNDMRNKIGGGPSQENVLEQTQKNLMRQREQQVYDEQKDELGDDYSAAFL